MWITHCGDELCVKRHCTMSINRRMFFEANFVTHLFVKCIIVCMHDCCYASIAYDTEVLAAIQVSISWSPFLFLFCGVIRSFSDHALRSWSFCTLKYFVTGIPRTRLRCTTTQIDWRVTDHPFYRPRARHCGTSLLMGFLSQGTPSLCQRQRK